MIAAFEVGGLIVQPMAELAGCGWFFLDHTIYMEDRGSLEENGLAALEAAREVQRWRKTATCGGKAG